MDYLKIILFPFSILYGLVIFIRNALYDAGILKDFKFNVPVLCVGNLSVGGTGKTPHIEYLIRFLQQHEYDIATLSRGYKRKTSGYKLATLQSTADEIGDEPRQLKQKFPGVSVAVGENRVLTIPRLLGDSRAQLILLDDAFQHRAVRPGHSIILTDYSKLFTKDYLLPFGRLREWRSAYRRADTIIVTKCPEDISQDQKQEIIKQIKPLPHQSIYFSFLEYGHPFWVYESQKYIRLRENMQVVAFCGIANPDHLENYLTSKVEKVRLIKFGDHHRYEITDFDPVKNIFQSLKTDNKLIITTEKDLQRLQPFLPWFYKNNLPLFCLPVQVKFQQQDEEKFQKQMIDFIESYY